MYIKLYQINCFVEEKCPDKKLLQRAVERRFMRLATLREHFGADALDPTLYVLAYEGEVEAETLEDLFVIFNLDKRPVGFTGHSMSVSDIVQIERGNDATPNGVYYCDTFGFQRLAQDAASK